MPIIDIGQIKYRWANGYPALPGELEPIEKFGVIFTVVSLCDSDRESNLLTRKFRGLLGYGPGWTFKEVLIRKSTDILLYLALVSACSLLSVLAVNFN